MPLKKIVLRPSFTFVAKWYTWWHSLITYCNLKNLIYHIQVIKIADHWLSPKQKLCTGKSPFLKIPIDLKISAFLSYKGKSKVYANLVLMIVHWISSSIRNKIYDYSCAFWNHFFAYESTLRRRSNVSFWWPLNLYIAYLLIYCYGKSSPRLKYFIPIIPHYPEFPSEHTNIIF